MDNIDVLIAEIEVWMRECKDRGTYSASDVRNRLLDLWGQLRELKEPVDASTQ